MADHQITQNMRDSEKARQAKERKWAALLDAALRDTGGPITANERAWADSILNPQ